MAISPVRVSCDTLVKEFVAQVQESLIENLHGAEWACRKIQESSGECAWADVDTLCKEMRLESLLRDASFQQWYSKLNRKHGVPIRTLLQKWLYVENTSFASEAKRYEELLAKTRLLAGEARLLTRAQCQSLTKEFDKRFQHGSKLQELGNVIKELFTEWSTADDKVSYLNLLVAWIGTRRQHSHSCAVANFK